MYKKTKRQLSEGELLYSAFLEFVKCWGSGRRSRLFMESVNGEAFLNFSTFLGNPGKVHFMRNKMAPGNKPQGHPEDEHGADSNSNSKPNKNFKRKKSKKKTERNNKSVR